MRKSKYLNSETCICNKYKQNIFINRRKKCKRKRKCKRKCSFLHNKSENKIIVLFRSQLSKYPVSQLILVKMVETFG